LLAVVLCSYFLAKMVANGLSFKFGAFISGPLTVAENPPIVISEKKEATAEELKPILDRNIFDSKDTGVDQGPVSTETVEEEVVDLTGEAVPTSLGIKLVSTFSVGNGEDGRSSSIISSGKGAADVYTVGDAKSFAPETKIVRILFNRVEFSNKGRLEYVELEDFAKGVKMNVPPPRDEGEPEGPKEDKEVKIEKKGESNFVIDRSEIEDAINNLDKLYTQVRAVPNFKDGKPNGLKLLSVRAGSIFSKLGLQRGDILKSINGMEMDIKRGLDIFNKLKSENHITIDLERRDATQTFEYEIR